MARPRVALVLGAADEEQLQAAPRSRRTAATAARAETGSATSRAGRGGEGLADAVEARAVASPDSSVRARSGAGEGESSAPWASHRNAMFGASSRAAGDASTSARGRVAQACDLVGLRPEAVERHLGPPEVARHVIGDVALRAVGREPHVAQVEQQPLAPEHGLVLQTGGVQRRRKVLLRDEATRGESAVPNSSSPASRTAAASNSSPASTWPPTVLSQRPPFSLSAGRRCSSSSPRALTSRRLTAPTARPERFASSRGRRAEHDGPRRRRRSPARRAASGTALRP